MRPTMRFVEPKTTERPARAVAFSAREQLVKQRTAAISALRGHLYEFGHVAPEGIGYLIRLLGLTAEAVDTVRASMASGDRSTVPGLVRISVGIYNATEDIDQLAVALEQIAAGRLGTTYRQDPATGDYIAEGVPMDPAEAFSIARQVLPGKTGATAGVRG